MSPYKLKLSEVPKVGLVYYDGGQAYTVEAAAPHRTRDGRASAIITWRGTCKHPGCSSTFTQETGFLIRYWRRYCDAHKLANFAAKPQPTAAALAPGHVGVSLVELAERVAKLEKVVAFSADFAMLEGAAAAQHASAPDAEPETNDEAWSRASEVVGRAEETGPWGVRVRYKFTDEAGGALPSWVYYPDAVLPESLLHMADDMAAADLMGGV